MGAYTVSILFLLVACLKLYKIHKIRAFHTKGTEVTASVLKKEEVEAKWGIHKYWLHYVYDVAEGKVENKSEVGFKQFSQTTPNDELTIIYQKDNAELSYLLSWYLESLSTQITWVLSFVLAAILIPILF